MAITAKRNAKDTVFKDYFSRRENLLALYKALHPEDTDVTENMLGDVTIKNVLTDRIYNDLGFTVGSRLMILVEAQSTWSANIIIRALMYMAQSYQERFEGQGLNLYSSKKIELPEPELYVIFTGDRHDRPDELQLSEEFFGGKRAAIEVTVKMLYGENGKDVIGQYVRFCKVFNMQTEKYGLTEQAVKETIRICKDEDVLKAYLEAHEKEARSIMMALFDDEYIREAYGKEKFDEGGENKAKDIALNMHKAGMSQGVIAKLVGYAESVVAGWISEG